MKVQANALVTRCSNLERGCEVGYGTVVEDASILRDTCLGTGLDVTHAVVWGRNLLNLRHDVALEINDPIFCVPPSSAPGLCIRSLRLHQRLAIHRRPMLQAVEVSEVDLNVNADGLRDVVQDAKPGFVSPRRNAWAG